MTRLLAPLLDADLSAIETALIRAIETTRDELHDTPPDNAERCSELAAEVASYRAVLAKFT